MPFSPATPPASRRAYSLLALAAMAMPCSVLVLLDVSPAGAYVPMSPGA